MRDGGSPKSRVRGCCTNTRRARSGTSGWSRTFRRQAEWAVSAGLLMPADLERFEQEVETGLGAGLRRGLSGERRLPGALSGSSAFLPFLDPAPEGGRRTFV